MLIAEQAFTLILGALICYRVTRLLILDKIFKTQIDWVHAWLLNGNDDARWRTKWLGYPAMLLPVWALAAGSGFVLVHSHRWIAIGMWIVAVLWAQLMFLVFSEGPTWLGHKIEMMIGCPYCLSVWVGLGFQLLIWPVRSVPLPAMYFLAVSAGGMVIYQYIDFAPEEDNELD